MNEPEEDIEAIKAKLRATIERLSDIDSKIGLGIFGCDYLRLCKARLLCIIKQEAEDTNEESQNDHSTNSG